MNRIAERGTWALLTLMLSLGMLLGLAETALAQETYTQLTKKTFQEVADIIDGEDLNVYYYDGSTYTEVGYVVGASNPNWYYIVPKGSVTTSNSYYDGKRNSYYDNGGTSELYTASADPDVGSQSIVIKATGPDLEDDTVLAATVLNPDGEPKRESITLNKDNGWQTTVTGLGDDRVYTVEVGPLNNFNTKVTTSTDTITTPAYWEALQTGAVENGHAYAFVYEVNNESYALSANGTTLTGMQLADGVTDDAILPTSTWTVSDKGTSYTDFGTKDVYHLQNGTGQYLGYTSLGYSGIAPELSDSKPFYKWVIDTDGSIWNNYNGTNQLYTADGTTFSAESNDCTIFTPYEYKEATSVETTVYTINVTKEVAPKQLYVRLTGQFDNMIVGQSINDGVDTVSGATTGGGSFAEGECPVYMEYALADPGTKKNDVPEASWKRPDYFINGNELTIDGAQSKITIRRRGSDPVTNDSGIEHELNPWSGGIKLKGTAQAAGTYEVVVSLVDTNGRTDTSDPLEFKIYSGEEKLIDQLIYANCTKTADGKYMFDNEPWYIKTFGGENETVTVPKDIKAWYGSHGAAPTINYGELGQVARRDEDGKVAEPAQTLIIPNGCNLTMVNIKVHSGVKIIVENGGKLVLRQTTMDGIIEVRDGGTFSMDYNDYGDGEWLHGSMINGQLRMLDGSTLDHARITAHANYLAEFEGDTRTNGEPVVVTEGNVNIVGDVFILGENAPSGGTGQPALLVRGTLKVPEGSTLACYGGGDSNLTATGGDAIELEDGTITGAGSVIAVGGYGINLTSDESKGKGGAAVSGTGTIDVQTAYLEGGSADENRGTPSEALVGSVTITDTTNCKLVTGASTLGDTSSQYWHGTGDTNDLVPNVEKTLALVMSGSAPAGVSAGRTGVKVSATWTDERPYKGNSVTVEVRERGGDTVRTLILNADNNWTAQANDLDSKRSYIVSASADGADVQIAKGVQDDSWADAQLGNLVEGETYVITYEDDDKTYMLGAHDGAIGRTEWSDQAPKDVPEECKWVPAKSGSEVYGEWYLMNQSGEKNTYLGMRQNGLDVIPCLYTRDSTTYYTLFADDDGSIWSKYFNVNLLVEDDKLTTSNSSFTAFAFRRQQPNATENFVVKVNPRITLNPVTITATNKEIPYSADGIAIPVEGMFDITKGAGAPTFGVENGTGEGAYDAQAGKLKVARCGTFTVKASTAATETHGAGAEVSATLTVARANISKAKVTLAKTSYVCSGNAKEPAVKSVTLNGTRLRANTDYVASYKANVKPGTATVTVTGKGNYEGTAKATFSIVPTRVGGFSTAGHPAKGTLDASWESAAGATSYQLSWRKAGGKWKSTTVKGTSATVGSLRAGVCYEVRVRAKAGTATGAWSKSARRWLKKASSVKVVAGKSKGTIKVSWAADEAATGGYVAYTCARKEDKVLARKAVAAGKTSATISGLKSGKAYYVKVRPMCEVSGTTYSGVQRYCNTTVKVK